jgi:hypothetical protein
MNAFLALFHKGSIGTHFDDIGASNLASGGMDNASVG